MDGGVKGFDVGECLVSKMKGLEIVPDDLDVVEFGGVLGQPLDGEPMGSGRECGQGRLADVDRAIVEHDHDGLDLHARLGAVLKIEGLQQRNEVAASSGGEQINDFLDGFVGAVIGSFDLAVGAVSCADRS